MNPQPIPDYELPYSKHANVGLLVHILILWVGYYLGRSYEIPLTFIIPIIVLLIGVSCIYWMNVDHKRYSNYEASYVAILDTAETSEIRAKIIECGFGSSTERFLTSYLLKKRPEIVTPNMDECIS